MVEFAISLNPKPWSSLSSRASSLLSTSPMSVALHTCPVSYGYQRLTCGVKQGLGLRVEGLGFRV